MNFYGSEWQGHLESSLGIAKTRRRKFPVYLHGANQVSRNFVKFIAVLQILIDPLQFESLMKFEGIFTIFHIYRFPHIHKWGPVKTNINFSAYFPRNRQFFPTHLLLRQNKTRNKSVFGYISLRKRNTSVWDWKYINLRKKRKIMLSNNQSPHLRTFS